MTATKYSSQLSFEDKKFAAAVGVSPLVALIVSVLRKQEEPITTKEIADIIGSSGHSVRQVLHRAATKNRKFQAAVQIDSNHRGIWIHGQFDVEEEE